MRSKLSVVVRKNAPSRPLDGAIVVLRLQAFAKSVGDIPFAFGEQHPHRTGQSSGAAFERT